MNSFDGLDALRRANPRDASGFAESVATARLRTDVLVHAEQGSTARAPRRPQPRRRWLGVSAATLGLTAAVAVAAVAVGVGGAPPGVGGESGVQDPGIRGPGVQDPVVSLRLAAEASGAAAEQSGKAAVRITKDGQTWAGKIVTWHGDDLAVVDDPPRRPGRPGECRLVDGILYGTGVRNSGWVKLGPVENIDPDSGTTPLEMLEAVRDDSAGKTFNRITGGMTDTTTRTGDDGSVTYTGSVAAGLVAMEEGFKEGQHIRVLPYGYVAHDAAANPVTKIRVSLTVRPDHLIGNITATWGGGSAWVYTVTFTGLGTTPPVEAPKNARSFLEGRRGGKPVPRG